MNLVDVAPSNSVSPSSFQYSKVSLSNYTNDVLVAILRFAAIYDTSNSWKYQVMGAKACRMIEFSTDIIFTARIFYSVSAWRATSVESKLSYEIKNMSSITWQKTPEMHVIKLKIKQKRLVTIGQDPKIQ